MTYPLVSQSDRPSSIYKAPDGREFVCHYHQDGSILLTPIANHPPAAYYPNTHPQQSQPDLLTILIAAIATTLGITAVSFAVGFAAGSHGREVVTVPRSPICNVQRSGGLLGYEERETCK